MILDSVENLIKHHEGLKLTPYKCTADKLTIGYGRNLEDRGITSHEADVLLHQDIEDVVQSLENNISYYHELSEPRRAVLIDMCFNLGWRGLSKFVKFFDALQQRDFDTASREMMDSKWASQVGLRATRLSVMMRDNSWPRA